MRVDSGIGQYTYWLLRCLPSAAPDLEFGVLLPRSEDPLVQELAAAPDLDTAFVPGKPMTLRSWCSAAAHLWDRRPLLYHSPDWLGMPPLAGAWRTVHTVHDLIPLVAPEWVPASTKARHPHLYRGALRTLLRFTSLVLTDSSFWAAELQGRLRLPAERIRVVPLGVAPPKRLPSERIAEVLQKLGVGRSPYLLTVGRPEPYKGLAALIRAFAAIRRDEILVVAGALDSRYPDAREVAQADGIGNEVIFTGPVDPEILECLYQGAAAYATLSRLEGFGLPPLEAMARGLPVLATRIPIFEETLGDAAVLVAPDDPVQLRASLRVVLRDRNARRRLEAEGPRRTLRYSWTDSARRTAEAYRLALSNRALSRQAAQA